ncbi:hypothetical protein EYF80_043455 [Liparis tanakae]|uniref:Uncharacterized protein n=1 Tax=Liparis tanakae TaxID=230148 RepID=A0A4Z2FYR1_9TELE|nr:hypothetical protein EYF80_043455 [Liparis tanakae]
MKKVPRAKLQATRHTTTRAEESEVCVSRSHDTPVADDENAEVELEDRGEEGKGHGPRPNGEEVPQHLGDHGLVGHGQLVVAGVSENLLMQSVGPSGHRKHVPLTLQWEDDVSVDHDAQLEDELRSRLQEGFQEAQHGDVSALKHQPPVDVARCPVAVPTALGSKSSLCWVIWRHVQSAAPMLLLS